MKQLAFFLLLFFVAVNFLSAQSGWNFVVPTPTANATDGAACIDSSTAIVVGDLGTILRTTDGGLSWQAIRAVTNNLLGLCVVNRALIFAYGEQGTIIRSTDTGISWIPLNTQTPATFNNASMCDPSNGFIVGTNGILFHTSDGGRTWHHQKSGTSNNLNAISCISPQSAVAVGDGGIVLRTDNAGATWTVQAAGTASQLSGVCFVSAAKGFIFGSNLYKQTTDGGISWTDAALTPFPTPKTFCYVKYFTPDSGVILAGTQIYHTSDGGANWTSPVTEIPTGGAKYFPISFCDGQTGVAGNGFSRTTDGGNTWRTYVSSPQISDIPFVSVAFGVPTFGLVATSAQLYVSNDTGKTWRPLSIALPDGATQIASPDAKHATVVGPHGYIIHTADAGAHWTTQTSGTAWPLNAVAFSDSNNGFAVGGYIYYPTTQQNDSADTAYHFRIVLHTINGGATWTKIFEGRSYVLTGVSMIDSANAMCCGVLGTITKTTDAGNAWSEEYIDGSPTLNAIDFIDHHHVMICGNTWYIARSIDGGLNWSVQHPQMNGSVSFSSISFVDSSNGTVAGIVGTILHTTDGGYTWYKQWTATFADINAVAMMNTNIGIAVGGRGVYEYLSPQILRITNASQSSIFAKSRASIDFGNVALGLSRSDSVLIVNRGAGELIMRSIIVSNPMFTVNPGSCIIEPGDSLWVYTSFIPLNIQDQNGVIYFSWMGSGSLDSVMLHGKGFGGPVIAWNKEILFGDVRYGTTKLDSITVYNRGDEQLQLLSATIADTLFNVAPASGNINAGDSMIIHVRFAPKLILHDTTSPGHVTYIIFNHNGITSPDSELVKGVAVGAVTATRAIDFGRVLIGGAKVDSFIVKNIDIEEILTCDSMVCGNRQFKMKPSSCSLYNYDTMAIDVTFKPDTGGAVASYILVYHSAIPTPDTVFVTGTGVGAICSVSRRIIDFGVVPPDSTKLESFVVKNVGNLPLDISSMYTDNNVFVSSPDSMLINAGDSATVYVTFTPISNIHNTALVLMNDNAPTSPDTVRLFGDKLTGISDDNTLTPVTSLLIDNYPNPFSQSTMFQMYLPQNGVATLRVYSILGQEIASLFHNYHDAGVLSIPFNAAALPAGVYRAVATNNVNQSSRLFIISK